MIELNLLPKELRKKRRKIELPEIPIIPITVAYVAILVGIQVILGSAVFLKKQELAGLKKKWQLMEPKKKELDAKKTDISSAVKKVNVIEDLMKQRISWSLLLNEVSNSLTPNIWLTELDYNEEITRKSTSSAKSAKNKKENIQSKAQASSEKTMTLTISGQATGRGEEGTAYIARFIKALKENPGFFKDFDDIELVSIKQGSVAGQDIMNFTILCKIKAENNSI